VLVSPVDSAWEILKGHILKASAGEPPDKTERNLINDICHEKGKNARTILKQHENDERLLVRLNEIVRKYDNDFNLASASDKEPIYRAVTEDGSALWPAGCEDALFQSTSKMASDHYKRMSPSKFVSNKEIMLLSRHPDESAGAMLSDRLRDLVELNPDAADDAKKEVMARLEDHISELDRSEKTEKTVSARMRGREGEEGYENHVREVLHKQHRMRVLKNHYRDRAASEIVGELQGVKKHHSTCPEHGVIGFPNCECPSILDSQRSDYLTLEQRMGGRHHPRHWENENLKNGVVASINDLVHIMCEFSNMANSSTIRTDGGSRKDRLEHWWKNTPWDQRKVILGLEIKYKGKHSPSLPYLLGEWMNNDDKRDFLRFVSDFEGSKSKRRREGTGARGRAASTDPGIIGDWSSNDLFHYLSPDESFASPDTHADEDSLGDTTYEDVDVGGAGDSGYGGETHFGHEGEGGIEVEDDPYSEEDIVGSEYASQTGSVRGGRKSRKPPFQIYTQQWFSTKKEKDDWLADMQERVKLSESGGETVNIRRDGKEIEVPLFQSHHPDYLTKSEMKDIIGQNDFAAECIENLNKDAAEDLLEEKRGHMQKEIDEKGVLYDGQSRGLRVSPKTMDLALEVLGFSRTPEGQRYGKLKDALFTDGKFMKENPDHILDSGVGRAAINNLLQGAEKHREAAGQTVRTIQCTKCGGSRVSKRRSSGKGGRLYPCGKCRDPFTGESTGYTTAYREGDASPEQKEQIIHDMRKEYEDIKASFIPSIRDLAHEAGFSKQCQGCKGSGEDEILRDSEGKPEKCIECEGYGNDIFLEPYLKDIYTKQEQGLSAEEAMDAAIKDAERRHSILKYRDRERLHDKRMSDLEKYGLLSNGVPALFYMNRLHEKIGSNGGGVLNRKALEAHRKEILDESPDIGFHRLKQELADRLLKVFSYIDRKHDYHGLKLADAIHSPYFEELLNILSEKPHLGEATDVTSAKLKRHLMEINHPDKFEHRPSYQICPSCEGTKKERDHHTHNWIDGSSCTRCSVRGKPPTGYIHKGNRKVSRIFDLPEIRTGVPECPCCKDGSGQMINSPGGLGKSTRVYHFPIDHDFDTMTTMDHIFDLENKLKRAQTKFSKEPNDGNKNQVMQIYEALNDAIEEETPLLTKTLGMRFERAQAESGKTGRSMAAFIGGAYGDGEFRDYGVSWLDRRLPNGKIDKDWQPTVGKTPCPFCAEVNKRGEPLPGKLAGTTPMLGDKDGYHSPAGFLGEAQGCPSDSHREDGATIFSQMVAVKHWVGEKEFNPDTARMEPGKHHDMLDLIEDSWSKGPVIDDLRDRFPVVSKSSPEEKRKWFEKNPGKKLEHFFKERTQKARDRDAYSPRPPQTIGDYMFNKFAALRRKSGKPTPQERITHKGASSYLSQDKARVDPVSTLQKTDYLGSTVSSDAFTKGEHFLDKLDSSGILDFEDDSFSNENELKRLFAIHCLIPDYYGHRHSNPLYMTGGESEKDLRKWARNVLGVKRNHPVGEEMKSEFRHNLHMIEPLLQLEKEWSHYYLAPREEMVEESGWPTSIFNTTDSKQPFLNQDDLQRVFGELRGHYRDWWELMDYGHYSPDHHGFVPPTVHFPDLCLFLNNQHMPEEVAKAWFNHDDKQLPDWMHTKGKSMEEMQELASVLWAAGQGDQNTSLEYPKSVEWMEQARADGNDPDESTKMLWFRIRDMLQRRSRDPEGSKKALEALMTQRNRTQLNQWGFPTGCPCCKGEGQVTAHQFLERAPAFIDMVDDDGYFSDVPLGADGTPLEKVDGAYQMNDPKVHEFFKDHARSYSHPNWVDHKEYDKKDPYWRRHVMMQCPGCKGTHVCPSCDGHTGRHHASPIMMAVRNIRNMLHKEAMGMAGRFMKQPVMEDGPVEMQTDTHAAEINNMPAEVLEDYVPARAQIEPYTHERPKMGYIGAPTGKKPPDEGDRKDQADDGGSGILWVEEEDDEGESTGYYYTIRDPWHSNRGGRGTLASFDRELKRVTAEQLFEGLSPEEFYDREDKKDADSAKQAELWDLAEGAKNIREGARWDPGAQTRPKAVQEMIDRNLADPTLKPSKCVFPGCNQDITYGQKYCTGEEMYPHISVGAGGRKFMEMRPTEKEAPNHFALVKSPHYKDAVLNSSMPSKNYWGGREPIEKMLELGFKLEGSKRFGVRQDMDTEAHKEFMKSDFVRVLNEHGWSAPYLSDDPDYGSSSPFPKPQHLRGRNKAYNTLRGKLANGEITPEEYEKKMKTTEEGMKPLSNEEFEEKMEEMRTEWFNVTRDAVAAWRDSIEKIDMHIPYFTHPEDKGRVFTPFDIFDSQGIPQDHLHSIFDYIPHGLDPDNNPQHKTNWKTVGGQRVGLYSVIPKQVCKRCWSDISKEERENCECDTCGETLASEHDIDSSMMGMSDRGVPTSIQVQASGTPFPQGALSPFINSAKHPDLAVKVYLRDRLRNRAAYIAEHMKPEDGEFDPAMTQCKRCSGHGILQDEHGNPVKCGHCVQIPDLESELGKNNHMVFNDVDKDALMQVHTPNYRLMKGNPQDPNSWKPIDENDEEEFKQALKVLRLGAGGSKISGRILGTDVEQRLRKVQIGDEDDSLEEVVDEDKAEEAEQYLRTFLQIDKEGKHSPVHIPTMNPGLFSNNVWANSKGDAPLAKFKGHDDGRNKVQTKVNEHLHSASHDLLSRELFRLAGVRNFTELGNPGQGGGKTLDDGTREFPSWVPSARAKKLAKSNMKTIRQLKKKKNISETDQAKLEDALLLKEFIGEGKRPAWVLGLGNPIAVANQAQSNTEGYMLAPKEGFTGVDIDMPETIIRGSIMGNENTSSAERAAGIVGMLDGDNNHWVAKGIGSFGVGGLEYTNAMRDIVNRAESAFFVGGPKLGTIMDGSHVAHSEMRSEGALMKNALFTPSALHDEAHKAYAEGREEHGDQYMGLLGHVFKDTDIDTPMKNEDEIESHRNASMAGHSEIDPMGHGGTHERYDVERDDTAAMANQPPMSFGASQADSPSAVQAQQWGADDETLQLSEDPAEVAWANILKNLAINH